MVQGLDRLLRLGHGRDVVFHRAGLEDEVDDLPLEDLGGELLRQPLLLEPRADPPGAFAAPLRHRLDLHLEILLVDLDLLGLGDLGQQDQFLERAEGRLAGIGADRRLAGADLVVRDPLLAELHDQPADRAGLLAADQVGGQVERRPGEQLIEDLPPQGLALLALDPPPQGLLHRLAQLVEALEPDRVEERGVGLGEPHLLQVVQPDVHRHGRAPQRGLARRGSQLGLRPTHLARPGAHQGLAQLGHRAVAEPQLRLEAELDLLDLVEHAAVRAEEHQVGRDVVAQLRGPLELGHDLAVPLEVLAEIGLDIRVGDRPDRALQREPLVIRQLELRADLHVDLEVHRALFGQLDGRDVQLRLRDRIELIVRVELLQRRHQQRRLDLVGDLLLEPLDHELSGCAPGPEARHGHVLAEVVERLGELPLDLAARDRDLDVLLARAGLADVDVHLQLALRPRVRLREPGSSPTATVVPASRSCSSVLINSFPSA